MLENIGGAADNVGQFLKNHNPDLYSDTDIKYFLSRMDGEYQLGVNPLKIDPKQDGPKIWSLPPEVLDKVKKIIDRSGHFHGASFIMGTYDMTDQSMQMNDICAGDAVSAVMMANGMIEGLSIPFWRGVYYTGRSSWWRHESIHARHHHQMAYFIDSTEKGSSFWVEGWANKVRLEEAGKTIHEAGIEELLTRWQTLKESRGLRERAISTLSLGFYLQYAPFTGLRNMLIDAKENSVDLIEDGRIRIPIKAAVAGGVAIMPKFLNDRIHMVDDLGQAISRLLPISGEQAVGALWYLNTYAVAITLAALLSSKEKGLFEDGIDRKMPTSEYKFPYVYNPVTSFTRSVGFLRYLNRVWDQIPNYRLIESPKDIDFIKRGVDDRLSTRMDSRELALTMQIVGDALKPYEGDGRSSFPQDAYIKGMFIPALYLRLRELYH